MHIYQKNILDLLRQNSSLRYSELQPDYVESSHFKYHLNQLIKDGLVEQISRGVYGLTNKGKTAVDRLSRGKVNPDLTPKVITYTLLKDKQNYFLQLKDKEPYLGLINMIGGKVHVGESTRSAASREVLEKSGFQIEDVSLAGIAEILINNKDDLLTHVIAYIYVADIDYDESKQKNLIPITIKSLSLRKDLAPDLIQIVQAVESSKALFAIDLNI